MNVIIKLWSVKDQKFDIENILRGRNAGESNE